MRLAPEPVGVDGERETGIWIVSLKSGDDVAHVSGATGQSGEAWVDGPSACRHDKAFERCEAHCCVDRTAAEHRTQ